MTDVATAPDVTPAPRPVDHPEAVRLARYAQNFANIVAVLMRDPGFQNLRLADLEWLVLPAIMSGQWRLAQSKIGPDGKVADDGVLFPSAVALWASVSPEIDQRLSENLDKPLLLKSHEWLSGDVLWLVAAAGDRKVVPAFLKQLAATDFKGKQVKARVTGPDGKIVVRTLRHDQ